MTETAAKHTPGPWSFDHDWRRFPTIFGANGIRVAIIEKDKLGNGGFVYELPERYANARLIVTAPETHGAATRLVERADSTIITDAAGNRFRKVFADDLTSLHAAIAKAEGRTP